MGPRKEKGTLRAEPRTRSPKSWSWDLEGVERPLFRKSCSTRCHPMKPCFLKAPTKLLKKT
ncbi:hypothetical protein DPMN_182930 [Dreissena polymorpha]|uniref:Uncharacterized protein n=1 Tax=Dreissena polymorpha TaxID=45954 RepID=A0A9D4DFT8_DREPO|nr:hypothetical protein DPMN_182930 [Dreissena polymorpha]